MMVNHAEKFPHLFDQILAHCKESSFSDDWAFERFMDLFCKQIANDAVLVRQSQFGSFLKGFTEDKSGLIQYPICLMNNVSLMATQVLVSDISVSEAQVDVNMALTVIRSPMVHHAVTPGHRAAVTLDCLRRCLGKESLRVELAHVDFDASPALAFALASPHNYVSRAASNYLHELVKILVTEDSHPSKTSSTLWRSKLKEVITELVKTFNARTLHQPEGHSQQLCEKNQKTGDDSETLNCSMVVRYLQFLTDKSLCKNTRWIELCGELGVFACISHSLCTFNIYDRGEFADVLLPCFSLMLLILDSMTDKDQAKSDILSHLHSLCAARNKTTTCQILPIAREMLHSKQFGPQTEALLQDLMVLPLYVATSTPCPSVHSVSPSLTATVMDLIKLQAKSRNSSLFDQAMKYGSEIMHSANGPLLELLEYLSFQRSEPPSTMERSLHQSEETLDLTVAIFKHMNLHHDDLWPSLKSTNIQSIVREACKVPHLSFSQLETILTFYNSLLEKIGSGQVALTRDDQILQDVLMTLQWKMADIDPNFREVAMAAVVKLYFTGALSSHPLMLPLVWRSVGDSSEDVVGVVLGLIDRACTSGCLSSVLSDIGCEKKTVLDSMSDIFLSRQKTTIKAVTFSILANLLPDCDIVKYAETGLQEDNPTLALEILNFADQLVVPSLSNEDAELSHRIQKLVKWLEGGWFDLVFSQASAEDTTCFRKSSSILLAVHSFLARKDVADIVLQNLRDSYSRTSEDGQGRIQINHASVKELLKALNTSPVEDKKPELEEPPSKKRKTNEGHSKNLDDGKRDRSYCLTILTSGVKCVYDQCKISRDQKVPVSKRHTENMETDSEELFLDSTTQLPPLSVTSEPLPIYILCNDICSNCSRNSQNILASLSQWVSLIFVRDLLTETDPSALYNEACRSTDEYERNSSMFLSDLEDVIAKTFSRSSETLMEDLLKSLIEQLRLVIDRVMLRNPTDFEKICADLGTTLLKLHSLTLTKDETMQFLLRHRRTVYLSPVPDKQSSLDEFLHMIQRRTKSKDILEHFCKESELMSLLEAFLFRYSDEAIAVDYFMNKNLLTRVQIKEMEHKEIVGNSGDSNSFLHEFFNLVKAYEPSLHLSKTATFSQSCRLLQKQKAQILLKDIFSTDILSCEKLDENVKTLVESDKYASFSHLLHLMLNIVKRLVSLVCQEDSKTVTTYLQSMAKLVLQVQEWFLKEDDGFDSEGDNDPTAIDCF